LSGAGLLASLTGGVSHRRQKLRLTLVVLAAALLLVTLARPQWGFAWEEAKQRGLDIVVALDVSKSMLAEDVSPNRLERAKLAALDLTRFVRSDRLALVPFAGGAFLQCPLTLDYGNFSENVRSLDAKTIPRDGTALPEAIETALTVFPPEHQNEKALVIISDGENHEGDAIAAAQKAAKAGMRIFTIGVGTAGGELIPERDTQGRVSFHRDAEGNVVKTRLAKSLLEQIAKEGNGFYLPLQGANTMELLYRHGLEPMPKSDLSGLRLRRYHEHYAWPLALAIVFLLVEMFVPERKAVKGVTGNRQLDAVRNP
jgi:Ca-activated chloride channel homolog